MKTQRYVLSALEKRLEIGQLLPRMRVLSAVATIVTLAVCFWPISKPSRRATLASGPLSNHHRLIEAQCERCHQQAFRGTPNPLCERCHTVNQHAAAMPSVLAAHPELEARCASCHKEHHGARSLVPTDSPLCTGCHKRIDQLLPKTEQASFGDFDHHPEFAVNGWVNNPGTPPVYRRVRLGEKAIHSDTQIKFSHKEHMALGGKAKLTCGGCHETAQDNKTFRPVSFEHHCGRCHGIEFDDRLPGVRVPHGNQDNVLPFVTAAIAKLHFDAGETGEEARQKMAAEIRDDEVALYTENGGCSRCHDIEESVAPGAPDKKRYVVTRPKIPERWMPASRFSHPTHHFVECESCHAGRSESTSAADIILPSIDRCRKCHADPPTPGKVASPCLQCHSYHAASPSTGATKTRGH